MRESPGNYQQKLLQVFPDLFARCYIHEHHNSFEITNYISNVKREEGGGSLPPSGGRLQYEDKPPPTQCFRQHAEVAVGVLVTYM